MLLKLKHESNDFDDVVRVPLLQFVQASGDESFTIVNLVALVETCDVFHCRTLIEYQTA